MIRELFHIGPLSISPFGALMVIAFLVSWAQLNWGVRRLELGDDEDSSALLLAAGVGGVVGAKIYYAILEGDLRVFFSRSGLVWYGGLILGAVAVLLTARLRRLPVWGVADVAGPTVAIGYAVGRVGCFLVGDDYGYPTDLPWGVAFPYGLPGPTTAGFMRSEYGADLAPGIPAEELVRVHPTQLYETVAALVIWWIGVRLLMNRPQAGQAGLAVFGLLAIERFAVEFLRAKDDRFLGSFTVAQLVSLLALLAIVILWTRRRSAAAPGAAAP